MSEANFKQQADILVSLKEFKKRGQDLILNMIKPVLISINLKNFKYFNQIYGIEEGDQVLYLMKDYFCLSSGKCHMAAMSYADHLCGLMELNEIEDPEHYLDEFGKGFVAKINEKYPLAKIHINCGIYIIQDKKDEVFTDALDNARYARRSINEDYRSVIAVYNEIMRRRVEEDARVIPVFEEALEKGSIELYFQPKFAIDTQQLIGAEVLSRIYDSEGNMMLPSVYIPVLEKTGLISHLDDYVIRRLIDEMHDWEEKQLEYPVISVNMSRVDFIEPDFLKKIDEYVEEKKVPKSKLEFELTETTFCENFQLIVEKIEWLRSQGYRISMDDFGTGYNSLDVLGTVSVDVVKFDRAFVLHSLKHPKGIKLLRGLIQMFQNINFEIICEGVETKSEEEMVYRCGCNAVQGFLYDKPIRRTDFVEKYL